MTNRDKALLRALAREGKTLKEIKDYLDCANSTIRSYIKVFNPKPALGKGRDDAN